MVVGLASYFWCIKFFVVCVKGVYLMPTYFLLKRCPCFSFHVDRYANIEPLKLFTVYRSCYRRALLGEWYMYFQYLKKRRYFIHCAICMHVAHHVNLDLEFCIIGSWLCPGLIHQGLCEIQQT